MNVTSFENLDITNIRLGESSNRLIIELAAIHNGITRNLTHYTSNTLKASIDRWTKPYEKKVLKNHDIHSEPLGRVVAARFGLDERNKQECLYLTCEITDEDAIKKIMDKRYTTVSIGGTSDSIVCSICKQNLAQEGLCDHVKGEVYDGNLCYWIVEDFSPDEISFVNAPSDEFAGVISFSEPKEQITPTITFKNASEYSINISEEFVDNTKEEKGKDGKEINKMDISTRGKTNFAHRLLHMWWKNPSKTNWTREQIKKEHARVVRAMLDKYNMNHNIVDGLDQTLPDSLKSRSSK